MKTENSRLGRCSSCRYWKSASDLLAERTAGATSPKALEEARIAIRAELSAEVLNPRTAEYRGWCTAVEHGETGPGELMAINLVTADPARMITTHDYGCLNYAARPRRAMNAPPPDFTNNERLGRCASCHHWSGAENEANALLAMERYTDPNARMEDAQRQAYVRLSPPPFDPRTGGRRGWCKAASDYACPGKFLAIDPATGAIGALITSRDNACVVHREMMDPRRRATPNWRWLANRNKMHNFGPSAPLNELLWSYLDPATLLDENHPLSPLHAEHPLNIRNPRSLYFNPNPAFAAYITNPSLVNTLIDPDVYRVDETGVKSEGIVDANRLRTTPAFLPRPGLSDMAQQQLIAQARLAQDFTNRTLRIGPAAELPAPPPPQPVTLKKDSKIPDRRRKPKDDKFTSRPAPGGAMDRRKS